MTLTFTLMFFNTVIIFNMNHTQCTHMREHFIEKTIKLQIYIPNLLENTTCIKEITT